MASIQTAIQITDRVSAPLNSMIRAIDKTCSAFERMSTASDGAVDTSAINEARTALQAAVEQTNNLGDSFETAGNKGKSAFDGVTGKVKGLIAAYASLKGVQGLLNMSDDMALINARLDNMRAGFGEAAVSSQQSMQEMYVAAQNARMPINDYSDVVARFGTNAPKVFTGGTKEVMKFTTAVQQQMKMAGTSTQEASGAILQLSQALGSGVLQGDEFRSLAESAPLLVNQIAEYMGKPREELKKLGSEGLITADIVKNAVLQNADEINEKFQSFPKTWSDVWTSMQNTSFMLLQPVLAKINELANNEAIQNLMFNLMTGFYALSEVLFGIVEGVAMVSSFISDNWSFFEPIIWGIVGALGAYLIALGLYNTIQGISAVITGVKAAADMFAAGATFAATVAQQGFNAALLACPITWIVLAIMALIAAIIIVINVLQDMGIITDTVFGILFGCIYVAMALFMNLGFLVINICAAIGMGVATLAQNMIIAFQNSIASIKGHFYDLLATAADVVTKIANMLNKLPFVNIDVSGITAAAESYRAKAQAAYDSKQDYKSIGDAMAQGFNTVAYKNIGDAWNSGKNFGNNLSDSIGGKLDSLKNGLTGGGAGAGAGGGVGTPYTGGAGGTGGGGGGKVGKIADDTGKIANAVTATNEEIKYLRDIAEREIVNRFTTAQITINQNNNNNVSSDMDIDGITNELTIGIQEAIAKATEGVHA